MTMLTLILFIFTYLTFNDAAMLFSLHFTLEVELNGSVKLLSQIGLDCPLLNK